MKQEILSMKQQQVYMEVDINTLRPEQRKNIILSRWVLRDKGSKVLARIVAKGFTETVTDLDDIYASTPIFCVSRTLITLACTNGWIRLTQETFQQNFYMRQQQQRTSTCIRQRSSTTRRTISFGNCWKQFMDYVAVQKHGRNICQKSFNKSDFTEAQQNPTSTWQQHATASFLPMSPTSSSLARNRSSTSSSRRFNSTCYFDQQVHRRQAAQ